MFQTLGCLFLVLFSLAPAAPEIHVRRISQVEPGRLVRLADIAEFVDLEPQIIKEIGSVVVFDGPVNSNRHLTGFQVSKILRKYLPKIEQNTGKKIKFSVPPIVKIQNPSLRLPESVVIEKIQNEFKKLCSDCEFRIFDLKIPEITGEDSLNHWDVKYPDARLPRRAFSIPLRIESQSGFQKTFWVTGGLQVLRRVPVALRNLNIGERIAEGDFAIELKDITMANDGFPEPSNLIGRQIGRGILVQEAISYSHLAKEVAVKYGQTVKVFSENEWVQVTLNGVAQEKGEIGDRIRVLNPSSKAIITAIVEAPGVVRVQ